MTLKLAKDLLSVAISSPRDWRLGRIAKNKPYIAQSRACTGSWPAFLSCQHWEPVGGSVTSSMVLAVVSWGGEPVRYSYFAMQQGSLPVFISQSFPVQPPVIGLVTWTGILLNTTEIGATLQFWFSTTTSVVTSSLIWSPCSP